ncbi:hypothetical protein P872_07010 [Rhodonellum psychrophilum GCM71 = DSM 17998]|uniref:DUF4271 domain-containing protein n=2 Tax=Rhodonellum TaxID=336827 RepID=U5BMY0_9BACT|nr:MULTISPECIES: DUF4271 domain-containing protein [Rhodonellum]ERM81880.1 hypothetical protein P872_07010 [Rhodonellum psychrophilum GCM71 = DSM 17998]SDY67777.1 protein of unknown function [Rhodonellum ikkaensis]
MIYNKRLFFLFTLIFCLHFGTEGQVIENYESKLKTVDQVDGFQLSEMIQVNLDVKNFPLSVFKISIPATSTVFLDQKLWFYAVRDTAFRVPSSFLRENFKMANAGNLELTVFKKEIVKEEVSVIKGYFGVETSETEVRLVDNLPQKRAKTEFYDFYFLALIIVLFLVAIYKMIYPLVLASIITPVSVFSAEDFSESNSIQKFFSVDVIFYILIVNMLLTLLVMAVIQGSGISKWYTFVDGDLNQLFLNWLLVTLILFGVTILKFLFLRFLAFIFDLGKFEFSHFFYLLRIISILVFLMVVVIAMFALNNPVKIPFAIKYGLTSFFWVYVFGIFMLFIIMMKRVSFKKYHLFAYICTAELVPFLIIAKLILGLY